jgi:hypothetical protein
VIHFFDSSSFFSLFWCPDAKGGEESIYLAILMLFIAFIWIWLVRLYLCMSWSCGHGFRKLLWCACKNLIMACMNLILSML